LRFDFTAKKGMTSKQIAEAEAIVNEVIAAKRPVDAMETPLAQAREINGLRAMFGAFGSV
jgi:alanyl-tRNA synthetase